MTRCVARFGLVVGALLCLAASAWPAAARTEGELTGTLKKVDNVAAVTIGYPRELDPILFPDGDQAAGRLRHRHLPGDRRRHRSRAWALGPRSQVPARHVREPLRGRLLGRSRPRMRVDDGRTFEHDVGQAFLSVEDR
jgi:hypothetical protein